MTEAIKCEKQNHDKYQYKLASKLPPFFDFFSELQFFEIVIGFQERVSNLISQ